MLDFIVMQVSRANREKDYWRINCLCIQTQEHFQPRVHGFEIGMKLEAVHPMKPSIICPSTVTKSLGPYYFAVTTDYQENVPSVTFCCHSDSPGIFPAGWCSRHQVDLSVPASKWYLTIWVVISCDLSSVMFFSNYFLRELTFNYSMFAVYEM